MLQNKAVILEKLCLLKTHPLLGNILSSESVGPLSIGDRSFITSLEGGGGGRWFWRGGTILKQAPFWGVNFSLVRNMRGVKFYDTATAV